jgi:acetyltransferase-like isoleucine patch superfamily enzyme
MRRTRAWFQLAMARADRFSRDVLEIRTGDPLAKRFAAFGARSVVQAPWLLLSNPASIAIGDDVVVRSMVSIEALAPPGQVVLQIGNGVEVGHYVRFVALNGIVLDDGCGVGHGSTMSDTFHEWSQLTDAGMRHTPLVIGPPLRVGTGAMVGTNCYVAGGLSIGARSIVAQHSVVTRDVAPDTRVAGNPARRVPIGPAPTEEGERL